MTLPFYSCSKVVFHLNFLLSSPQRQLVTVMEKTYLKRTLIIIEINNMFKILSLMFVHTSCVQGSEIFIVSAKDGDQSNPNPVHYSIINGKPRDYNTPVIIYYDIYVIINN